MTRMKSADYFWEWDTDSKEWILVRDEDWVDPHNVYIPRVPNKYLNGPKPKTKAVKKRPSVAQQVKRKDQGEPTMTGTPRCPRGGSKRVSELSQKWIRWQDKRDSELSSPAFSSWG
jgi:hypothetical protein